MQITKIQISNYRNLDGLQVNLDPRLNFLIGENDLGKSNLLDLFNIIFNNRRFPDEDFKAATSIRVDLSLKLSETEKGIFEDYFDPNDSNCINLFAVQEYSDFDEDITFYWKEAGSAEESRIKIPSSMLRQLNYISYTSLRIPQDELSFSKVRGTGRFLRYLINEFVNEDTQFTVEDAINPIKDEIQSVFDRLRPLKQQKLGLSTEQENSSDLASRILKLSGADGIDIQKSGYGIQFSTVLVLAIMERLVHLKQNKRYRPFEENRTAFTATEYKIFTELYLDEDELVRQILEPVTTSDGELTEVKLSELSDEAKESLNPTILEHIRVRKKISMVLGLDEPDVHLPPYKQRMYIKYIHNILKNTDKDFLYLLKRYFGIDAIDGQAIVVSHSPAILLDKYKHIVRFYKKSDSVHAICGTDFRLELPEKKQLLLQFPNFKEAFFSRCVIVVEGDTELGAIPIWIDKMLGDIDEYGITVLKAGGVTAIPTITKLLEHFAIPHVSIADKDDNNHENEDYTSINGLSFTKYRDFEEDLIESVSQTDGNYQLLFGLLEQYGDRGLARYADIQRLKKIASKYAIGVSWECEQRNRYTFKEAQDKNNPKLNKAIFLSWLTGDRTGKDIILGRFIGNYFGIEYIPENYKQLIEDAKNKANSN